MLEISNIRAKSLWFYILSVAIVFGFGCAGQVEEKQQQPDTEVNKMPPPAVEPKLPPGRAKIEARMIELNEVKNHFNCIIKVNKVLGYGMATKPIGKGTEISLQISNDEKDLIKLLSEGTREEKYEFTVEQEQMVDNQLRYRAVKVKKIHSDN
jgi:hypothetical protein